jgi:hypothetical protein
VNSVPRPKSRLRECRMWPSEFSATICTFVSCYSHAKAHCGETKRYRSAHGDHLVEDVDEGDVACRQPDRVCNTLDFCTWVVGE